MKRVAFATLGCKVNQFETADMIEQFSKAGWELVPFSEEADLYLINSCTVTGRSDSESRRLVRRARKRNPESRVVATGCYAQVNPEQFSAMPELDQLLGNEEKRSIVDLVEAGADRVSDLTGLQAHGPLSLTSHTEHTRAFLQIQNGCEHGCSYCIVPYARGPYRSVPLDEVLNAVRRMTATGFREVVLTGIHLGAYGCDLSPPLPFISLLRMLAREPFPERLRLGSIEPNELGDEMLELIAGSRMICHHLHLPMQSGSDTVLSRMGRGYDSSLYRRVVEKTASRIPDAFIAADMIAGFPGETDREFEEGFELARSLPLSDIHVFPYSRRPGTAAANMPDQLPPSVITKRAARLRKLAEEKRGFFRKRFIGKTLQVLGQQLTKRPGIVKGLSRNYLEVLYPGGAEQLNVERELNISSDENGMLISI